jgi:hypothetical protein
MTYAVAKGGVIPLPAAIMRGNRAVVQHRAEIDCDDAVHVVAFTKSLAREVARHSINVNCACPGPTDTPMLHSRPEKLKQAFLRAIPFRRFASRREPQTQCYFSRVPVPTTSSVRCRASAVGLPLPVEGGDHVCWSSKDPFG